MDNVKSNVNANTAALNKSSASAKKQQVQKKRTPFFIFCTDKRGEVREAHPDMAITEQAKILGRMWGALSDKDKNEYQQLAVAT